MMLLLISCSNETSYQTIGVKEAKENLDTDETIILIDVRTQMEYDSGHIVGAELLTLDTIEASVEPLYEDKDQVIYVYCQSGRRSKLAAKQLIELGYNNIYDLGGINSWPYDTE